jgi:sec-independent protein translocase protein TatC
MSEEPEEKLTEGTLISHLLELRNRLIKCLIAVVIAFIPLGVESNRLFTFMAQPLLRRLPPNAHLIATGVMAPFMTPFMLSMYMSVFVAMPFILYQVWAFVAPGLYRHEKRFAIPLVASSIVLFYCGIAFAFFAVFPVVFRFLTHTAPQGVEMMTDINSYLSFVMHIFFAFGLAFEAPVAVVLLVLTGLVGIEKLKKNRGYVLIIVFVIAAAVTPPDSISMTVMAVPMYLLYEVGLFFAKIALKMKREQAAREEANAQ